MTTILYHHRRAWYILHECAVRVSFNLLLRKAIKILAIVRNRYAYRCTYVVFLLLVIRTTTSAVTRKCKNICYTPTCYFIVLTYIYLILMIVLIFTRLMDNFERVYTQVSNKTFLYRYYYVRSGQELGRQVRPRWIQWSTTFIL